jgi:hypothetical protein
VRPAGSDAVRNRFEFTTVVAAYLIAGIAVALWAHFFLAPLPEFAWLFR